MNEKEDIKADDIELQQVDVDKTVTTTSTSDIRKSSKDSNSTDKPPTPPKRDYATENATESNNSPEYARVKRKAVVSFPTAAEFVYKPENPEALMSCLRISLIVFNLFIWLLGAVVTALGIWMKVDQEFWAIQTNLGVTEFTTASYILIAVGVVVMLVGFIGCYGAIASQICMLVLFSIVVGILVIMEIAVMALVWSATTNKNTQETIKLKATLALNDMAKSKEKAYFIALLQSKLKCCGVNGPQDYNTESNQVPIPPSCTDTETGESFSRGCYDAVEQFLKGKAAAVGGIAIAILILQIIVIVFSVCLICSLKQSLSSGIL